MVAQIDAADEGAKKWIPDRQSHPHMNSRITHVFPSLRLDHRPRTKTVGHRPARHTTGSGTLERLDNFAAVVIRQPDVKDQVNVIDSRINVGNHRVNRGV